MLLKKKNIVVNMPDNNKAEIERHIKELGFNEYKEEHIYQKPRRKNQVIKLW